jgi:hypothetical protein
MGNAILKLGISLLLGRSS